MPAPEEHKLADQNESEPEISASKDGKGDQGVNCTPRADDSDSPRASTQSLKDFLATLQRPADNKCFRSLGTDGIYRILTYLPGPLDQPTGIAVYDG
jgi:hypothetical protein